MAPYTENVRKTKKQKLNPQAGSSPQKTNRRAPLTKEIKKRLIRRISSTGSERSHTRRDRQPTLDRNQEAPTFYQPTVSSLPEEEEDEEDDSEAVTLRRLSQLPEEERFKAIGKMCALKIWPWPSPNWWITNTGGGARTHESHGDLDTRMKNEFTTFLGIDMGMSADEWMRPKFRQEVLF
jgi:hypothetical protein